MDFKRKLNRIAEKNNSLVCVGLDSDLERLPKHIKSGENPQFTFNKVIIEATCDLVCAYKPNIAFYEAEGVEGIKQLKLTIDYIKDKYPEIPVILDAKRADIGNTNNGYVKFVYDFLGADAITTHPYLGKESLKPFLERSDKALFVLCRTSNPGAGEFQDLLISRSQSADMSVVASEKKEALAKEDKHLYQIVAEKVAKDWNYNGNCGLVAGATYPAELQIVRRIAGNMPILIPGIGAQGADTEKTVKAGVDSQGQNAIINSSRAIIFASQDEDFAKRAQEETEKLRNLINQYRD